MPTRLERSTANKVIGGVCGGIAEYLQVDATLVRVFFVISIFLTAGLAILGYIVLLVLMPLPGAHAPFVQRPVPAPAATDATAASDATRTGDAGETTVLTAPVAPPEDPAAAERRRATFGYFMVAIGIVFLLANLGVFRPLRWDLVWPLVLVGAGVLLLAQRVRR